MVAPFPYEAVAGVSNDPAESEALNLYDQFKWVARLADEMNLASDFDKKRAVQIVNHLDKMGQWYDSLQAHIQARLGKSENEIIVLFPSLDVSLIRRAVAYAVDHQDANAATTIAGIVQGIFAAKKCVWATRAAMNSDLLAIRNAGKVLADWVDANAIDDVSGYSINRRISRNVTTDDSIKVAKTAGVATRLADFRALFAARG